MWAGLMNIKEEFLRWGRFRVGDGHATRFWDDTWILDRQLKDIYSNHFNIVRKRNVLVKDVMNGNVPNLSFRRSIVGVKRVEWHNYNFTRIYSFGSFEGQILMWTASKWSFLSPLNVSPFTEYSHFNP